ncbi:MAG: tetratricopeptide repeat protein [Spirochaetales bacterium]|nr:tetratricopeptide repeat protein [Spirochaetales bacterium]
MGDKVFILNSGKVSLNYEDIETGQEIHDLVKTGEFFGVKSALGRFVREETAVVLADSTVVAFSVPEFEQLVIKNSRVVLKMLKVFSNQLRRIQKQVQNLIYAEEHINPEKGLFSIGEYYLNNKAYDQAIYAFKRYLVYYPSGASSSEAIKNIETAESYLQKYGSGQGPDLSPPAAQPIEADKPQKTKELSDIAQSYYKAVSLISQEKYDDAYNEFKAIVNSSDDQEYISKSQYEMGRCLFYVKKYDNCIRLFTTWIQKYPKHPDLKDALYFIANSHEAMANKDKAISIYKKVLALTPESESLYPKARKALRKLEGEKA